MGSDAPFLISLLCKSNPLATYFYIRKIQRQPVGPWGRTWGDITEGQWQKPLPMDDELNLWKFLSSTSCNDCTKIQCLLFVQELFSVSPYYLPAVGWPSHLIPQASSIPFCKQYNNYHYLFTILFRWLFSGLNTSLTSELNPIFRDLS